MRTLTLLYAQMSTAKRTRTRTGCLTCRARKIKCDEAATICDNCTRSSLECLQSGSGSDRLPKATRSQLAISARDSERQLTEAGTKRRRIKRSCVGCKSAKKRCNGERPQCDRCLEKGQSCVYEEEHSYDGISYAPVPWVAGTPNGDLPDKDLTRLLCKSFFEEIAPLRCLGFLHRHTFLEQAENCPLRDNPNPNPLLLAVCALATKTIKYRGLWDRGCGWARLAQGLVLSEIHDISVHRLMCIALLYEHAARISDHRLCFTLSGLASRYTQALSLNLECDRDALSTTSTLSPVERESRRRLMWACYIMDTTMACGLSQLQAIDTTTIQIQLPCDDRYFLSKKARITATVSLSFDSATSPETSISTENQDLDAFLLRLFLIRERILRYVNDHIDDEDPWRLTSSLADLNHWKASLPPALQFSPDVIVSRREQSMLSPLVALHVQYHQINCLLYRFTIPSMLFPARAHTGLSKKASADFLSNSRRGWFDHACAMSRIFEVALKHRPASMEDPNVGLSAYNAIIAKFLYLTNFIPHQQRIPLMQTILPLVDFDLQFLKELYSYHPCVKLPHMAAEHLVQEAKVNITRDPTVTLSESVNIVGITDFPISFISIDHRTNPLAAIAQMRKDLPDVHAPDRAAVRLSQDGQSPGEPERLWVWT